MSATARHLQNPVFALKQRTTPAIAASPLLVDTTTETVPIVLTEVQTQRVCIIQDGNIRITSHTHNRFNQDRQEYFSLLFLVFQIVFVFGVHV